MGCWCQIKGVWKYACVSLTALWRSIVARSCGRRCNHVRYMCRWPLCSMHAGRRHPLPEMLLRDRLGLLVQVGLLERHANHQEWQDAIWDHACASCAAARCTAHLTPVRLRALPAACFAAAVRVKASILRSSGALSSLALPKPSETSACSSPLPPLPPSPSSLDPSSSSSSSSSTMKISAVHMRVAWLPEKTTANAAFITNGRASA
jgi:hypothetical protein